MDSAIAFLQVSNLEAGPGLDEVLATAARGACEALKADASLIGLAENDVIVFRASHNLPEEGLADFRVARDASLEGIVFRTGEPYVGGAITSHPGYAGSLASKVGIRSGLIVPLELSGEVVGCLYIGSFKRRRFTDDHVRVACVFARQIADSLANAFLLERERRERQRSQILLELVRAAGSSLSLKQTLIQVCEAAARLSVADRCSILLLDEANQTLEPFMSLGFKDEELWQRFRATAHVPIGFAPGMREAFLTQKPIIIGHADRTRLLPRSVVEDFGMKTVAIYPMVVRDEVVGIMIVDTVKDYIRFPEEEIETMTAIARQAAVVIENARLFEQVQQQAIADPLTGLYNHRHLHERLEQEMARAKRSRCPVAVLMIDVDNLKLINDTYGHQVGDEALKLLGSVLQSSCRTEDITGRYGGDEFMVILPGADPPEAKRVAERIQANLATRCLEEERKSICVPVRLSVGVACYPSDATAMHDLVNVADSGLYRSKQRGGGCISSVRGGVEELVPADSTTFGAMQGLVAALIQKEPFTREHVGDVAKYGALATAALGLDEKQQQIVRKAGWVHDVGKIAVPDRVVRKPGALNDEEWKLIRRHVEFSETILRGVAHLADVVPAVAAHHEWFDGNGYPRHLRGRRIPITARILSVADAYSAMTNDRPYRQAMSRDEAIEELRRGAGTQFDPEVIEAFINVLNAEAKDSRAA
jgi:diguanylate cyclase (GGDEF)-like protein